MIIPIALLALCAYLTRHIVLGAVGKKLLGSSLNFYNVRSVVLSVAWTSKVSVQGLSNLFVAGPVQMLAVHQVQLRFSLGRRLDLEQA